MIELKKLNVHRIVDSQEAADCLIACGFTVVTKEAEPNFSSMKVSELRAYAESKGIDLGNAAKKDEIIEVLKNKAEPPSDVPEE